MALSIEQQEQELLEAGWIFHPTMDMWEAPFGPSPRPLFITTKWAHVIMCKERLDGPASE